MTFQQLLSVEQATRALKLAHWLANRLWPKRPAAHGFYEPEAFFDRLWQNRDRASFVRALEADTLHHVRQKDAKMTREQLANRYHFTHFLEFLA